jgi:hypothetical protein
MWAVPTTMGTLAGVGALWSGDRGSGGLRAGTLTQSMLSGTQTRGTNVVALSRVQGTTSRREDLCPPRVVQEGSQRRRPLITSTDEA